MSIKYELSRWVDYPANTGLKEEKLDIIAATGMDFAGRAQNIVLKREYTGKNTLEFDIPVKYFDPLSGATIINSLCQKLVEKTKVKLWRDELWWNPFGGAQTYNEETECYEYTGAWQQGRWYDFIVSSHKEKRSKKQLLYSYKCDSLFINELSRNGYSLQFVANTDLMAANGMGTAHDLARRVIDGTDWEYIKTEVFPDYKEEFNAITGETVKTPVATDQIEFMTGLDRYGYCYELTVDNSTVRSDILDNINQQLRQQGAGELQNRYGFDDNKFWWKPKSSDSKKEYVYNYQKTESVVTNPSSVFCADTGAMKYYIDDTWDNAVLTKTSNFSNVLSAWEYIQGTTELISTGSAATDDLKFYMRLKPVSNGSCIIKYNRYDTSLNSGERYAVSIRTNTGGQNVQFEIWEHDIANDYTKSDGAMYTQTISTTVYSVNANAFYDTHYISIAKYISNPVFIIRSEEEVDLQLIYIYKLVGATKDIEEKISNVYSAQTKNQGLVTDLMPTQDDWFEGYNYTDKPWKNIMQNSSTGKWKPIWLGFDRIATEGYANATEVYLIEFNENGKYYQVYLPIDKNCSLKKISSANADKRRAISGEKSNRYSLLENIAKTFHCFTRFMVEHDEQGKIVTDTAGKQKKYFTFVSELGKKQFHGFNYGVNLESIERNIESENVVTKLHVENLENQYSDSNMITIQDSIYNKLGMNFLYNFSYYIQRGLLDKNIFLKDYNDLVTYVGARAKLLLLEIDKKSEAATELNRWENEKSILQLSQNSLQSLANEALEYIHWTHFVKSHGADGTDFNFPNIKLENFAKDKFGKGVSIYISDTGGSSGHVTGGYYTNEVLKYYTYTEKEISGIKRIILKEYNDSTDMGSYKFPINFNDVKTLSEYMAYNVVDIAGDGVWPDYGNTSSFWGGGLQPSDIENNLSTIFSYQNTWKNNNEKLSDQSEDSIENHIKIAQARADEIQAKIDEYNKEIQAKINWFERRYIQFIIEGQWQGKDYIDPDTYYIDATRAHAEACVPKVTYSIGALDLSKISNPLNPRDTDWGKDFIYDVGDTSYVKDEELFGNTEQLTMVATITSYIDIDKQDNIDMRNFETRFEELFQQIAASVTSVQLNENTWGKAANFMADGTINENILQSSIAKNNDLIISSANNSVVTNNFGLTITDTTNKMQVLRAVAGGIFFSNDGGINFKSGLTPEGLSASLVTAGRLDTSKIVIRNDETPLFTLDSQGLTAYYVAASNSFTRFDQFGIYGTTKAGMFTKDWWKALSENSLPEDYVIDNSIFSLTKKGLNFRYEKAGLTFGTLDDGLYGLEVKKNGTTVVKIDSDGNATFTGTIYAGGGEVGGWSIGESATGYGSGIYKDVISSDTSDKFRVGMKAETSNLAADDYGYYAFYVKKFSNATETNPSGETVFGVTYNGNITATKGKIGGWDITDTVLASTNEDKNRIYMASADYGGEYWIRAYNESSKTTYFSVSSSGLLYAKDATVDGILTAKAGSKIANWSITENQIGSSVGNYRFRIDSSAGGNSNAKWISVTQLNSSGTTTGYPFYVSGTGVLHATGAVIDGDATFSGKIKTGSVLLDGVTLGDGGITGFVDYKLDQDGNYGTNWSMGGVSLKDFLDKSYTGGYAQVTEQNSMIAAAREGYPKAQIFCSTDGKIRTLGAATAAWPYSSDERVKNSISGLDKEYNIFFDNLVPVKYKYNDGNSNRYHTGFIAQRVNEALTKAELSTQEFAGLIIQDPGGENELWALRYSEFIALNTWQIQKAKARISELESRVFELEYKLASLTNN